jgi:hypothetical protein
MATKKELLEVKSDVLSAVDAVMKKLDNIRTRFCFKHGCPRPF